MPSTRSAGEPLMDPLDDDDFDPDYRESSDESDADDLPKSWGRDRANWVEMNVEDIEFLYRILLEHGRSIMGDAFIQTCTINQFANFLYKHTTPFSEP